MILYKFISSFRFAPRFSSRFAFCGIMAVASSAQAVNVDKDKTVGDIIKQAVGFAEAAKTPIEDHQAAHGIDIAFTVLRERSTAEQAQVCGELLKVTPRDLVLMDTALRDKANTYLDGCREQLIKKVEDVYEKDRQELREKMGPLKHPDADARPVDDRGVAADRCSGKVGNYPPIEIDTTGGPTYGSYFGAHHTAKKPPGLAPKEIIFTLDDGPSSPRTEKALAAFEEHCVHATLFLVGQSMATSAGQLLVKKELDAGHNIGNHTYTHPLNMASPRLSHEQRLSELKRNSELYKGLMEKFKKISPENADKYVPSPFFRFPGGNEAQDVLQFLHESNMPSFTWQAGCNDWLPKQTAFTQLKTALNEIEQNQGGIFISHDTHQATVDMIPYLLDELTKRGYKIRHMIPKRDVRVTETKATPAPDTAKPDAGKPETRSQDGFELVRSFAKQHVNVRSVEIASSGQAGNESLIPLGNGATLKTGDLQVVALLGREAKAGNFVFKEARIEKTRKGLETFIGQTVYIWSDAF